MVAFDGRKVRQSGFIVFAWDPKATDEYMSSFLDSCKENDIEMRAKAFGHQPVGHNWHSLGYICLLARTEIGTDLGVNPPPPNNIPRGTVFAEHSIGPGGYTIWGGTLFGCFVVTLFLTLFCLLFRHRYAALST